MTRLFASLYSLIILGIFIINWGSETLWQHFNQQKPSGDSFLAEQLVSIIPSLSPTKEQLIKIQQTTNIAIKEIPLDDIAWLPKQKNQLNNGQTVVIYDQTDQMLMYVKSLVNNSVYQIIPLIDSPKNQQINLIEKYLILTLSYLLLAVVIGIWTRPVWRDLTQLSTMAEQINNNQFSGHKPIVSRSPISPIAKTINHMAIHIQRLINEQKQLIDAVSHELRTPLSRLRFSIALVNDLDEQKTRAINQDISEIEYLVDEMLSYSRIEHLAQEQKKSSVNISELLTNQVDKLQRGNNSIKLNLRIEPAVYLVCYGELLERASQNLITNAIRYAKQQVLISVKLSENNLLLMIEDDGCGIPSEQRAQLFNPFTRIDKSRNKQQGGYGLGLAIVKKSIDWHHGQCLIEQSLLGGASFTCIIPISEEKT